MNNLGLDVILLSIMMPKETQQQHPEKEIQAISTDFFPLPISGQQGSKNGFVRGLLPLFQMLQKNRHAANRCFMKLLR